MCKVPRMRLLGVRLRRWVLALAAMPAVVASAQQAPASLTGVVIDSLRGGALRAATVMVVDSTMRQAETDSMGRFRVDSIPPGRHRIAVFHPLLDTLDISLTLPAITFAPGTTMSIAVATPSGTTLLRQYCPSEHGTPALVLGRVLRAEDGQPLAGATVTLTMQEIPARSITSEATGRFRLCSPAGVTKGVLHATEGRAATGMISVRLVPGGVVLPVLRMATDTGAAGSAVANGRVVGPNGQPLAGAILTVAGSAVRAQTRNDGTFTLAGLPSGTQSLSVSAIGYAPATIALSLAASTPWSGVIRLTTTANALETVHVSAQRLAEGYARVGFTERQHRGVGTFMTYDDVLRKHPLTTTDLFVDVPGLYVDRSVNPPIITGGRGRTSLKAASGACVDLYVDGHRVMLPPIDADAATADSGSPTHYIPLVIDQEVEPQDVVAVEVYNNADTPVQFMNVEKSCQVIVVWTRASIDPTAPAP
jgi:carboxypeptidase family protein